MRILTKIFLSIGVICSFNIVHADQYEFENRTTPAVTNDSVPVIQSAITINRNFPNMASVIQKLNSLGLNATIVSQNQYDPQNQKIKTNTNVQDFIYAAAKAFNYTVNISGNNIKFTALYPPIPTPLPSPKPIAPLIKPTVVPPPLAPTAAVGSNLAPQKPVVVVTNNWQYSPNDKFISTTLSRWAKQANYQLVWQTSNDFAVQSSGSLGGSYKAAVNEVLKSFRNTDHPLKALWYQNNVVVITDVNN